MRSPVCSVALAVAKSTVIEIVQPNQSVQLAGAEDKIM
jgi:hypothetical protein